MKSPTRSNSQQKAVVCYLKNSQLSLTSSAASLAGYTDYQQGVLSEKAYTGPVRRYYWTEHVTRSVHPLCMTRDDCGECPLCGTSITEPWVLIEYENTDGTTGKWAECPDCAEIVEPE